MTVVDFGLKLEDTFKAFKNDANEGILKAILTLVDGLTDDGRDRLWNRFLDSYEGTNLPTRPRFIKLIDELGIKVGGRSGKSDRYPMVRCENNCGAEFSPTLLRCPKCRNSDKELLTVFMIRGEAPTVKDQQGLIPFDAAELTSSLANRNKPKEVSR